MDDQTIKLGFQVDTPQVQDAVKASAQVDAEIGDVDAAIAIQSVGIPDVQGVVEVMPHAERGENVKTVSLLGDIADSLKQIATTNEDMLRQSGPTLA